MNPQPMRDPRPAANPRRVEPQPPFRLLRADDLLTREAVFALRYRAYRSVEAIPRSADARFTDEFDDPSMSMSYLVVDSRGPIGSIRATVSTRRNGSHRLPCALTYGDALAEATADAQTIVESSRFVMDPDIDSQALEPLTILFRAIAANALAHDADRVVTAVRRKHVLFYRRMMGFRRISEARHYPGLCTQMMLLATDPRSEYPRAVDRMPAMAMNHIEAADLAL